MSSLRSDGTLEEDLRQPVGFIQQLSDADENTVSLVDGSFALFNSVMVDGGDRYPVSTLSFDSREELLWMGNGDGHVTSYFGPALEKYSSFQAHQRDDVRQILTTDAGVLALSKTHLKCNTRHGLGTFNYTSPNMNDLQCMVPCPSTNGNQATSLALGGYQNAIVVLDLVELKEIRRVDLAEPNCSVSRATDKFLFTGDTNGKIAMRNWDSLETLQVLEAHSGPISDFDIRGTKLVTCGFSARSLGGFSCDRFLMVYDLRMLRAMAPIPVTLDPFFLRFLPVYSDSRLLVASQMGSFQVIEIGASTVSPFFCQMDTQGAPLLSIDVSASKQCVAFGDCAGFIHLFSDRATPVFNECSRQTEFADPITPMPPISFTDHLTPLSIVPMHLRPQSGRFLSDWPPSLSKRVYRIPEPIDPVTLQHMKMSGPVGYAPRPASKRFPNVVPYDLKAKSVEAGTRSRSPAWKSKCRPIPDPLTGSTDSSSLAPVAYRKIVLKYGRDEPDYRAYNQTTFSALEPISPNSYINSLFQVLFHVEPLRRALLSHLCRRASCLSCEVAFLFHMLRIAGNRQACSASNFLRAFRTMPEATGLGLVLNERDNGTETGCQKSTNLAGLIQGANLFLLRKLHSEQLDLEQATLAQSKLDVQTAESSPEESVEGVENKSTGSIIERLFATSAFFTTRCKCGAESSRDDKPMVLTLTQVSAAGNLKGTTPETFAAALQKSLSLEQLTQSRCDECSKSQQLLRSRRTRDLPDVLIVNCPVDMEKKDTSQAQQSVATPAVASIEKLCRFGSNCVRPDCFYFHPERSPSPASSQAIRSAKIPVQASDGQQTLPVKLSLQVDADGIVKVTLANEDQTLGDDSKEFLYELSATIDLVWESTGQHLVANIQTESGWVLFNDYAVTPVAEKDVATFDLAWKTPCLLYFTKRGFHGLYTDVVAKSPIDERVLMETDQCVAVLKRLPSMNCVPLEINEIPKCGDHVALDAEFVTLNEEEAELHSNGTKLTIKPSQMSPARISIIRANGPLEGIPFMDDYISTQEEVVNYLTKFSGIKPGDLDPQSTSKHLTTLKTTYVKLRYLVDSGVIFIGHGLANDFKVLNLVVPADQMIDTVQLFRLPNRRMISLRFLAWHFLGLEIQGDTHDSVEDARTALKLYKSYQQLVASKGAAGFNRTMTEVYERGRSLQWQTSAAKDTK